MQFNVSRLLLESNTSRDTMTSFLTTQHALLVPLNMASILLNAVGFIALMRNSSHLGVPENMLGSLTLIDLCCGMFGLMINILYLASALDCSANCEMTINLDPDGSPSFPVTLLRYGNSVCQTAHYSHILMSTINSWLYITRPLQYQRVVLRPRLLLSLNVIIWITCVISNLPTLLDGLVYRSSDVFFTFRIYVIPVCHTFTSLVIFSLDLKLVFVAMDQIKEVAKLEEMQARFYPSIDNAVKKDCTESQHGKPRPKRSSYSQTQKNAHVVKLFLLVFGTFILILSPVVYYRAFRRRLSPTMFTFGTLLALDMLPSVHYVVSFLLIATLNKPFRKIFGSYVRSVFSVCFDNKSYDTDSEYSEGFNGRKDKKCGRVELCCRVCFDRNVKKEQRGQKMISLTEETQW